MILFIFEGKNDEPRLYKTLKEILHYYCFDNQIEKYVTFNNEVAVLNAFPLFWFEYIDDKKLK